MQSALEYKPNPVEIDSVNLPDDLSQMIEVIAENLHDIWARRRLDEGWQCGEKRNGQLKTTPFLIPYADLPESEKEYDRCMVTATIKLLLLRGYHIENTIGWSL